MIQVDLLFFLFKFSGKGWVRMPWSSSVSGNKDFLLTAGETCLTHSMSALYWSLKTVSGMLSKLSRWLRSALTRIKSMILWQTFWQDGMWEQVLIVATNRRIEQITINVTKSSKSIKYFLMLFSGLSWDRCHLRLKGQNNANLCLTFYIFTALGLVSLSGCQVPGREEVQVGVHSQMETVRR